MLPQKFVQPKARCLNTHIPGVKGAYNRRLEGLYLKHRIIERTGAVHETATSNDNTQVRLDKIDKENRDYMIHAEHKCRRIKSGCIPFSPDAAVWIRRCQVYRSILRYHEGKIRNRGNLKRTVRRCNISRPLELTINEVRSRLAVCHEQRSTIDNSVRNIDKRIYDNA